MNEPRAKKKSWTMDDSTVATNPGQIDANLFCWFRHRPIWPILWAGTLIGSIVLTFLVHWLFGLLVLFFVVANLFYWTRIKEQFRSGCACPGMVVSLNPTLIAVATDLSQGIGQFPAIKIVKMSLSNVAGQLVQIGTRVPTVAGYQKSIDASLPHWSDFYPEPVDFVTDDPDEVARVLASFSNDDWRELDDWLKQVPQPYQRGLYFIRTVDDN